MAALAGSQLRSNGSGANVNNRSGGGGQQTHEMTVPNDLIGCIIGKGGTKIAEIRYNFRAELNVNRVGLKTLGGGGGWKKNEMLF